MSTEKRLVRSQTDRMVGGVCGGIGQYFEIDPTLVRIAFAGLVLIGVGSPILLYLLLWIIMPAADSPRALTDSARMLDSDVTTTYASSESESGMGTSTGTSTETFAGAEKAVADSGASASSTDELTPEERAARDATVAQM